MAIRNLNFYSIEQIKRVRLVERADGNHDENAALNLLKKKLSTVRHTETLRLDSINASKEMTFIVAGNNSCLNKPFRRKKHPRALNKQGVSKLTVM